MRHKPRLSILRSLLFTYNIENLDDHERENFITSKNVNDEKELSELFDELTKPEFASYGYLERKWHIDTIDYFLRTDESFESIKKGRAKATTLAEWASTVMVFKT